MAITPAERAKMLRAHSIGLRMIGYLELIGIERFSDLKDADPEELAFRINIELGRRHINATGIAALANMVALASAEPRAHNPAIDPVDLA